MSVGREAEREQGTAEWHARTAGDVLAALDSGEEGLSEAEAERRLAEHGPNEIREDEGVSALGIFLSQFRDVLIYVLVLAALLSLAVGLLPGESPNYVDAGLILLILVGNGVFGFVQDYRAERAMERLRELSSPEATVLRDGEIRTVDASRIVPGDVLVLEQGDAVPADARLIDVTNLETMEAPLTGESATVPKTMDELDPDTPLAERSNMVYMNTNAVRGRGRAVVVGTGMETEVGGIATQIQTAEEDTTPFQEEVDELGRRIGYGVAGLIGLIVAVQFLFTDADSVAILLTAITLAVAAVPEGLPAVVTLTLALGSQRMVERNALVRRLPVVESLGSVDVILTDKTGTLTENQMTVRRVALGDATYEVTGSGLDPEGEFRRDGSAVDPEVLDPLLRCGALCNNAERVPEDGSDSRNEVASGPGADPGDDGGRGGDGERGPAADPGGGTAHGTDTETYHGDPTEIALLVAAEKAGIDRSARRRREIPFSSERRRMTVVVEEADGHTAYTKGAPGTVLERCDRVLVDGEIRELTDEKRQELVERNAAFARDALRVLGFARKEGVDPDADEADIERGLVFLGLQGMIDPPRSEVDRAVSECRDAGIRVVMATGDNLETARAIGAEIGFDPEGALTGREIEAMDDEELRRAVEDVEIFARAEPGHKVRVLEALQANGHSVAMTGDGVNDAPGLRNADVGIAMGIRGTDVTKEASDMVLQDDNFVTIRDAIAEGRGIFDNIRKFVNYLLSANAGEVLVVFVGVVVGSALFPSLFAGRSEALILTPVMLLWINLVTDGLPALALGTDPHAEGIMDRPPRGDDEPVIDRRTAASVASIGVAMTVTGLALFFYGLQVTRRLVVAQTLLFTFLVVVEVVRIQLIRSRYDLSPLSNRWLVGAVASSLTLQLLVVYTPLNRFFGLVPVDLPGWTWIAAAFAGFVALGVLAERAVGRLFPGSA